MPTTWFPRTQRLYAKRRQVPNGRLARRKISEGCRTVRYLNSIFHGPGGEIVDSQGLTHGLSTSGDLHPTIPGISPTCQEGLLNLEVLLEGLDQPSRHAFFDVLALEGFEITRDIPNLHMPEELDTAIGSLVDMGCGETWTKIHRILTNAKVYGTLVDLSFKGMTYGDSGATVNLGL